MSPPPPPNRKAQTNGSTQPSANQNADNRAASLAAMSANASSMVEERRERLTNLLAQEKAELEEEERARTRSKGMGGFLSHEQKKVFGGSGGLEERIRRGRGQMRIDGD